jgi:hypothetical protein
VRCYLFTSIREPNVAIYEWLGFKFIRTGEVKDGGEQVEVMLTTVAADGSSIACFGNLNQVEVCEFCCMVVVIRRKALFMIDLELRK